MALIRFGPAARILLERHGLAASQVAASGPHKTLLKSDVLTFLAGSPSAPLGPGVATEQLRKKTKHIPSWVDRKREGFTDVPIGAFKAKTNIPQEHLNVEIRPFEVPGVLPHNLAISAAGRTLSMYPRLCGESVGEGVRVPSTVNVLLETGEGVSVLRDANRLSPTQIAAAPASTPHPGTLPGHFLISSLPELSQFTLVLERPAVAALSLAGQGDRLTASLTYDASCVTASEAAAFLQQLKRSVENPFLY